jgi:hypothetical protein
VLVVSFFGDDEMVDKKSDQTHCSLDHACQIVFGGIGALSPAIYEGLVSDVARMCGRENDSAFHIELQEALKKLPCPMD